MARNDAPSGARCWTHKQGRAGATSRVMEAASPTPASASGADSPILVSLPGMCRTGQMKRSRTPSELQRRRGGRWFKLG